MPDFKKALQELRAEREKETLTQQYTQDGAAPFAGAQSAPRDGSLANVKSARSVEQELEGEEWLKKSELETFGRFNIIGANKRMSTYNRRTFEQTNFLVQLLDGEFRGCTAWCSFESNVVRDKIYNLVKHYGGVGPFTLQKKASSNNAERSPTYIFVAEDDESGANATAMHVGVDDEDDMTGNDVRDTDHLPFDAPPSAPAPTQGKRRK